MQSRPRFVRPGPVAAAAVLVGLGALFGAGAGTTVALFNASTTNPGTFTAKRIFPADRITSAWKLGDAAGGSESDQSFILAFADSRSHVTKVWPTAFDTAKYLEFELNASLPAGLSVSNPTFNFHYADNDGAGGNEVCFYFDVRRVSTGAVLATHGSAVSPIGCEAGSTIVGTSTAIPSVSSTDIGNDLGIRVYMRHSGSKAARIDRATVSGSVYGSSRPLFPKLMRDLADGLATTTTWGVVAAGDGADYQSVGNWSDTFSATRYLKFAFPSYVPNASVVTSASVDHSYRSATAGDTTCWYFEVYNGSTLIGTHGSSAAPISCNGTTSFQTDSVSIPEVDTAGEANNVVLKIYASVNGKRKSQHDLLSLNLNYSLGDAGCSDPGPQTLTATQDSWIRQDGAAANQNFGTDTLLDVQSQATAKNRRALVKFDSLPTIPAGCSFTGATLRMFAASTEGTRTLEAVPLDASWTELGVTWNNQPAATGAPATTANGTGWLEWNVQSQVQAWYDTGNDFGFLIRDSVDDSATTVLTEFHSRENTNNPELVVTFG